MNSTFKILNGVNYPSDLRKLTIEELGELCVKLRSYITEEGFGKDGHINSSLGVAELTVALHYVFNTPEDLLVWDVGHQAYIHKLLTGRKERFSTLRKSGGLSGFTKRDESEYDPFGAGHSSTSISAICGFAEADVLAQKSRSYIAVIGDGALTGGMSFEALNYAGGRQLPILVVLNDNERSIDDNVGYLNQKNSYQGYFKSLGFDYTYTSEGNNVAHLVHYLKELKDNKRPVVFHIKTRKGDFKKKESSEAKTYQSEVANILLRIMDDNPHVVVLSPAMLSGGGFVAVKDKFPERVFDTGISEQHVVTMAAGMAAEGLRPVVHLYSTFSQRAADQIIHDVALQNLPVIFALDRAGLVGEDGPTHHGVFDIALFRPIPNLNIYAPFSCKSIADVFEEALQSKSPAIIRYPKDIISNITHNEGESGVYSLAQNHEEAILSIGSIAAKTEENIQGKSISHYALTRLKPLPVNEIKEILSKHTAITIIEEGSALGGIGEIITTLADGDKKLKHIALPDRFIEHGERGELLKDLGLC